MPTALKDDRSLLGINEKILLYGKPGSGKTELWATAPTPIDALIIGPRNELKTLQSPGFKKRHGEPDIHYDYIQEDLGIRGRFSKAEAFDKACDALDAALRLREKGDLPFASLVIENASTLLHVQANKVLEVGGMGDRTNKSLQKFRDDNILFLADNDYMGMQSLMRSFVNWVYNIDTHVIFVAHEKVDQTMDRKTRQTIISRIEPNFIGQQRTEIPGLFDNVWRTYVEGGGTSALFRVDTMGDDVIVGKTRVGGVLKEKMTNTNIADAISAMSKGEPIARRST